MSREILVNIVQGEECRVAVVENGLLEELYIERASSNSHVGNIYKGKVVNVESSIQAAFIDFGVGKNGFLHISDLHPRYYSSSRKAEDVGKRKALTIAHKRIKPKQLSITAPAMGKKKTNTVKKNKAVLSIITIAASLLNLLIMKLIGTLTF